MKITEKIKMDKGGLMKYGAITIVVFGDSVSHGSVGFGEPNDYESVYHNRLRKKIIAVRDYMPVNVINSAVGGDNATEALTRLESQVIAHNPDLVIVCFGLNDVNNPKERYAASLKTIFTRCLECGAEVIYLTPNMLNTYVADDTREGVVEYAHKTARMQNDGTMDALIEAGRQVARECGVTICDCYAEWKKLSETEDVTMLLANRINHPTREMHELFAQRLFETIFKDCGEVKDLGDLSMYTEKK